MRISKMKMCYLLQEVHRACYIKFSGASVVYCMGKIDFYYCTGHPRITLLQSQQTWSGLSPTTVPYKNRKSGLSPTSVPELSARVAIDFLLIYLQHPQYTTSKDMCLSISQHSHGSILI